MALRVGGRGYGMYVCHLSSSLFPFSLTFLLFFLFIFLFLLRFFPFLSFPIVSFPSVLISYSSAFFSFISFHFLPFHSLSSITIFFYRCYPFPSLNLPFFSIFPHFPSLFPFSFPFSFPWRARSPVRYSYK